ncbi:Uncharacterised protein [Klebsiella pneumoniae]|nr:Uncharacterised protein [Klebsiella pneumoniae]
MHSKKLLDMPTSAVTHIQNTAPGPPRVTAMPTPAMLPAPTRPARLSIRAWKELSWPAWPRSDSLNTPNMWPKWRNWTKRERIVK